MYRTLGAPSGARGGSNGVQSGSESRMSTLMTPLNGVLMRSSIPRRMSARSTCVPDSHALAIQHHLNQMIASMSALLELARYLVSACQRVPVGQRVDGSFVYRQPGRRLRPCVSARRALIPTLVTASVETCLGCRTGIFPL